MAGGAHDSVPLYTSEGGWLHIEPEALVEDALAAREKGFPRSKVNIGKPRPSEDRARLAAVRDATGPDYETMTDANQCFDLSEAVRRARMLEEFDVAWFEEQMPADDLDAHARLAARTSVPIAAGKSMYSLSQFKECLAIGAASVVQADVARLDGKRPGSRSRIWPRLATSPNDRIS